MATVKLRLREWRTRRGLTVRGLAELAGVSYVTVVNIENEHLSPTVSMLAKLAHALECDVRDLIAPTKRGTSKPGRR